MTSRERAANVVQEHYGKRCWGYDPVQHAEYEELIAAAIDEAVAVATSRVDWRTCPDCLVSYPHPAETSNLKCPTCRVGNERSRCKAIADRHEDELWNAYKKGRGELRGSDLAQGGSLVAGMISYEIETGTPTSLLDGRSP